MAGLSSVFSNLRVQMLWILILICGLILFINCVEQLSSSSYTLAQDGTLLLNISYLINQANNLSNIGNYSTAIDYYNKVLDIQPNNILALHGKGLAMDTSGNHTDAVDVYNRILKIDPNNMDALASKGVILY